MGLPLWWCAYPGKLHDPRLFSRMLEEFARVLEGLAGTKQRLTVVMDRGMNSEGNCAVIDEHRRIHFITTYSLTYAPELARVPLSRYAPAATGKNRRLCGEGREEERLSAYRTSGTFWGAERTVVLTYNPKTARKQEHVFSEKLAQMREELLSMRALVREGGPHWRDKKKVLERTPGSARGCTCRLTSTRSPLRRRRTACAWSSRRTSMRSRAGGPSSART